MASQLLENAVYRLSKLKAAFQYPTSATWIALQAVMLASEVVRKDRLQSILLQPRSFMPGTNCDLQLGHAQQPRDLYKVWLSQLLGKLRDQVPVGLELPIKKVALCTTHFVRRFPHEPQLHKAWPWTTSKSYVLYMISVYLSIHLSIYLIQTYIHTYMHAYIYTYRQIYVHMYVYTYIYRHFTYIQYVRIYIYICYMSYIRTI